MSNTYGAYRLDEINALRTERDALQRRLDKAREIHTLLALAVLFALFLGFAIGRESAQPLAPAPAALARPSQHLVRQAPAPRADRDRIESRGVFRGWQRVDVTAYCATGHHTATGHYPRAGTVASNSWPLGTRLWIGELGETFLVDDRIGHGSDIDLYLDLPGTFCRQEALRFGRQQWHVAVAR